MYLGIRCRSGSRCEMDLPSLCLHPVFRLDMEKWNILPKEPTFPAFFLGALSVGIYPSDTFLKLEVCRTLSFLFSHFHRALSQVGLNVFCNTWAQRPPCLAPYYKDPVTSLCQRSGLKAEPPCGTSQCVGACGKSEVDYRDWEAQQRG